MLWMAHSGHMAFISGKCSVWIKLRCRVKCEIYPLKWLCNAPFHSPATIRPTFSVIRRAMPAEDFGGSSQRQETVVDKSQPCLIDNCGSTRFYIDDGTYYCRRNDHQQKVQLQGVMAFTSTKQISHRIGCKKTKVVEACFRRASASA